MFVAHVSTCRAELEFGRYGDSAYQLPAKAGQRLAEASATGVNLHLFNRLFEVRQQVAPVLDAD
jgi:hypothetical protein